MMAKLTRDFLVNGIPAVITNDDGTVMGQILILGMVQAGDSGAEYRHRIHLVAERLVDGLNEKLPTDEAFAKMMEGAPCGL